ncbi:hypothetical protein M1146_06585 [Patescibacteria group bacterium]|nr:hypothetical protein [Patescibacteria group bacterium]
MLLLTKKKYAARVVVERPDGQYTTYREAKGYFLNLSYSFSLFSPSKFFQFLVDDDSIVFLITMKELLTFLTLR